MKKNSVILVVSLCVVVSFLAVMPGVAQVPKKINYQGYLTDGGGTPVTGNVAMTFAIYEVASGGSSLWSETQNVSVADGYYSVILGTTTAINLPEAKPYYLGVTVGSDPEMTPREELTSVLYALFVGNLPQGSVLQTRVFSDYTRRTTGSGGYYYFGGSEFSNSITPTKPDSIILISINYFGEDTDHNLHARLQYSINSGAWNNFDLTGFGQQGTMKLGSYPDVNYDSTPRNQSTQVAKEFGTIETISFRMYHFNGGTFYHNSAGDSTYESAPSTLVLQELNALNSSYIRR